MTTKNAAAAALGRLGGRAGTPAQNAARRQNAQAGGRPGRVCLYCREPVGGHVNRALDATCGAHGWRWQKPGEERPPTLPDPRLLADVHRFVRELGPGRQPRRRARLLARLTRALAAAAE